MGGRQRRVEEGGGQPGRATVDSCVPLVTPTTYTATRALPLPMPRPYVTLCCVNSTGPRLSNAQEPRPLGLASAWVEEGLAHHRDSVKEVTDQGCLGGSSVRRPTRFRLRA